MIEPWGRDFLGSFDGVEMHSQALERNSLGDPADRPMWVYLPPAYEAEPDRRFPTIYLIQGFTGQVDMWWNRSALRPSVPDLMDGLFSRDDVPPCIVVMVDAWTSLGGSQFLNSSGTGRYMDYLCDDVTSFVDGAYRTCADRDHRALTGKSSGGFGAMVVPMLRPDVFGAFATHSGDALFEYCYMTDLAASARALRDRYDGSMEKFWKDFHSRPAFSTRDDAHLVNCYAMSACYSAEPDGSVTLPFDPLTGAFRPEVWERWKSVDPVEMVKTRTDAVRSMRGVYIDAGTRDEFYLDVGASVFSARLTDVGVEHVMELFDAAHGGIEYRYPKAWEYLARKLSA